MKQHIRGFKGLAYSTGIEANHPPLCPASFPGTPGGAGHIFDFPVALQAALVYSLPTKMK